MYIHDYMVSNPTLNNSQQVQVLYMCIVNSRKCIKPKLHQQYMYMYVHMYMYIDFAGLINYTCTSDKIINEN